MRFADLLPFGGEVLDVAPASSHLAIQMAIAGNMRVTALSPTPAVVDAARRNADKAGIRVDFQRGNPARMPFQDSTFDFVVCHNAFRRLPDPVATLREIHRVLKPGRKGVIIDLRRDVPLSVTRKHVKNQHLTGASAFFVFLKLCLAQRRAYSRPQIEAMLRQVPFGLTRIDVTPVGLEIWFEG